MDENFEYQLTAVAIAKNEAPYIKEWLDYHIGAGIECFYIYDNDSNDNLREVLRPYIESGQVEYWYYPGKYKQMEAYNDAIRRHKFDAKYMAFFDIDEFILPLREECILDILEEVFKKQSNIAGLAINCKSFGSSGHKQKPETGGVLENYQHRAPDGYEWSNFPWKWDAHVKTIVNPRKVLDYASPHAPKYFLGFYSVDERGNRVDGIDNFTNEITRIRVNHYFTKSRDEWMEKRNKRLADRPGVRPVEEFEWRDRNDVFDDTILKYRSLCQKQKKEVKKHSGHINLERRFSMLYGKMIMHPNPAEWKNKLGEIVQFWGIYKRELRLKKESDWQMELWRNLVFAALIKSLQSKVVNTYSLELVASVWVELCRESGVIAKEFRKLYIDVLRQVVLNCRSTQNLEMERYFSEKIQKILMESEMSK